MHAILLLKDTQGYKNAIFPKLTYRLDLILSSVLFMGVYALECSEVTLEFMWMNKKVFNRFLGECGESKISH